MARRIGSASGSTRSVRAGSADAPAPTTGGLFSQVFSGDAARAKTFWSGVLANMVSGAVSLIDSEDPGDDPEIVNKELLQMRLYIVHRVSGMLG